MTRDRSHGYFWNLDVFCKFGAQLMGSRTVSLGMKAEVHVTAAFLPTYTLQLNKYMGIDGSLEPRPYFGQNMALSQYLSKHPPMYGKKAILELFLFSFRMYPSLCTKRAGKGRHTTCLRHLSPRMS
jgi:hypothetical protein